MYLTLIIFAPIVNGRQVIVQIEQKGNHRRGPSGDFGQAVVAFRKEINDPNWKPDYDQYTWHHQENGKTMVLVERKIHTASDGGGAHVGRVSNNPNL